VIHPTKVMLVGVGASGNWRPEVMIERLRDQHAVQRLAIDVYNLTAKVEIAILSDSIGN
jgi:hypothetical protein